MKNFPEFDLPTVAGAKLSLGELRKSRSSLIIFYKSGCDASVYLVDLLNDFWRRLDLRQPVFWLVSQDSPEETRQFLTAKNIQLPAALDFPDYRLSRQLDFQNVPASYLLDPSGKILSESTGFVKDEFQMMVKRVAIENGSGDVPVFQDGREIIPFKPG